MIGRLMMDYLTGFSKLCTSGQECANCQYAAYATQPLSNQQQQLLISVGDTCHMALPATNLPGFTDILTQQFEANISAVEDTAPEPPYDFTPSAGYAIAQEADMAFFANFDNIDFDNDPAYQALVKEVGEAVDAGYYDDDFTPGLPAPTPLISDKDYELVNYSF
jgi:hypothetical protein